MRISNSLLQQRILRDLQGNYAALAKIQTQVATGKRFEVMSEDPLAGSQVLTADRSLRALEQYRRNSTAAHTRADAEESVLSQLGDLLARAKELAIQEGTATGSAQTRTVTKAEVDQIIGQVVALGNTQVGTEYLFAGHQAGTAPFDTTGAYFGDSGQRQAEIGEGYLITTNHTGQELLVNSGVLSALTQLRTQLGSGTAATVGATASALDTAFENVQTLHATNGARVRQIDTALQNTDALETGQIQARSDAWDVDIAAATTRLAGTQTTLQAALLSASRILNMRLTDYL